MEYYKDIAKKNKITYKNKQYNSAKYYIDTFLKSINSDSKNLMCFSKPLNLLVNNQELSARVLALKVNKLTADTPYRAERGMCYAIDARKPVYKYFTYYVTQHGLVIDRSCRIYTTELTEEITLQELPTGTPDVIKYFDVPFDISNLVTYTGNWLTRCQDVVLVNHLTGDIKLPEIVINQAVKAIKTRAKFTSGLTWGDVYEIFSSIIFRKCQKEIITLPEKILLILDIIEKDINDAINV